MTTANLRAIIEKYTLYPELQINEPTEAVIEQLRDDVHLETVNAEVRDPRSGGHKKPLSPLPWLTRISFPSLPAMSLTKMMRSHSIPMIGTVLNRSDEATYFIKRT